jgi:hypothetical protein
MGGKRIGSTISATFWDMEDEFTCPSQEKVGWEGCKGGGDFEKGVEGLGSARWEGVKMFESDNI